MSKGGSYSGFCDNNPTQCSDSLGSCGGSYSDENKAPFEDKDQAGGGYYLDVAKQTIGGLAEVASHPDYDVPAEMIGGSRNKFNFIINPKNGKKMSIFSQNGKNLLKQYVKYLTTQNGGAQSNFSPDMTTRDFSCKQPTWTPDCI